MLAVAVIEALESDSSTASAGPRVSKHCDIADCRSTCHTAIPPHAIPRMGELMDRFPA
jgi:hypothetical protein